jgi:hypothetical protein
LFAVASLVYIYELDFVLEYHHHYKACESITNYESIFNYAPATKAKKYVAKIRVRRTDIITITIGR